MHEPFLLEYGYLSAAQKQRSTVIKKIEQDSEHLNWLLMAPIKIDCPQKASGDNPKICISDKPFDKFIQLYHLALAHASIIMVKQTNHS